MTQRFTRAVTVGFQALGANPFRATLSTMGIVIGVTALESVLMLGNALERFARSQFQNATDVQTIVVQARTHELRDGQRFSISHYPRFTTRDAHELAISVPEAQRSAIIREGFAQVSWRSTTRGRTAAIVCASAGSDDFLNLRFSEGRYFTSAESSRNSLVVVLSHRLAAELSRPREAESLVGTFVRINNSPREVIGVLSASQDDQAETAYLPYSAAAFVLDRAGSDAPPRILLKASRIEDVEPMRESIETWLGEHYRGWERLVDVTSDAKQLKRATESMRVLTMALGALGGISLLVGGMGIMNVMLATVTERTREIGIRRAIGATAGDVFLQFLAESVAISGLGSAIGMVSGALLSAATVSVIGRASQVDNLRFQASIEAASVAILSALVVGVMFGTYPARRAARLVPTEAIRYE